jgi:hypothetical protein
MTMHANDSSVDVSRQQLSQAKPKIIFIASLSHSGSTLLDLMLNAHPEVVSVGEVKQLRRYARSTRARGRRARCTCGAHSLGACQFWSLVGAISESHTGQSLNELNVEDYADITSFNRDSVLLFSAIAAATNKRYIVDSSKNIVRLEHLIANQELDVFPILLIRGPEGQICSSLRKNTKLGKSPASLFQLITRYVGTNRRIHKHIKHYHHAVVRYEELTLKPEKTLSRLMERLGLTFHPLQLQWATQERHNVGGNNMRFGQSSELRLDEHWRKKLTLAQRLAIDVGTLPGRYPFVKLGLR